ncbi:uncharacterized protein LOC123923022 [Trifolium pratense]|nr:uncharacterized protein LOC123923022 [Trifolium pratense]
MYMRKKNIVLGTTITSTLYEKYMTVADNNVYGFEPFDFNLSYYCTQEFANWWRLESGFTQPQINKIEQQVKPAVTKKQLPEAVEKVEEPSKERKRSTTTTETGPSKKPKPSVVIESEEEEEEAEVANLGVPSVSNELKEPTPQAETQKDTILSDASPDPPINMPQQDAPQEENISNKTSGDTFKDSEATISEKIVQEPSQDQPKHPDSNETQDKTSPFQEWGKSATVEVEASHTSSEEEDFDSEAMKEAEAGGSELLPETSTSKLSASIGLPEEDSEINSSVRQDSLISKLYSDFINGDILASMEEHPSNAFKHKSFLNRLHNPHTDVETLGKVIKLESILDQFAITVQNLRHNSQKLAGQQAAYDALFEKAMAAQSKVEQMKAQAQQPGLGIQECNSNIAKWEAEIQSFRAEIADREQKILEEKNKRSKIEEAVAATTQESIRDAAKEGISHFSAADVIKEEIKSLEDAIKIQSVEVGLIKDHYADFKSKCLP